MAYTIYGMAYIRRLFGMLRWAIIFNRAAEDTHQTHIKKRHSTH